LLRVLYVPPVIWLSGIVVVSWLIFLLQENEPLQVHRYL